MRRARNEREDGFRFLFILNVSLPAVAYSVMNADVSHRLPSDLIALCDNIWVANQPPITNWAEANHTVFCAPICNRYLVLSLRSESGLSSIANQQTAKSSSPIALSDGTVKAVTKPSLGYDRCVSVSECRRLRQKRNDPTIQRYALKKLDMIERSEQH